MVRFPVYLPEKELQYLKELSGTVSQHIRQAIEDYVDKQKVLRASASVSKRGGGE